LSKPQQIALNSLDEWLHKETASVIDPLTNKATSIIKETKNRLDDTLDITEQLQKNSQAEMQKNNPKTNKFARNANKFAEGLIHVLNEVKTPEQTNYSSTQTFSTSLEKTVNTTLQLRAQAYAYITPYFIFDRRKLDVVIKRLSDIHRELRDFITDKYVKAKTIEETTTSTEKLKQTITQARATQKEIEELQPKHETLKEQLTQTQQEIAGTQTRPELTEIAMAEDQINELRANVKHNLRHLQKPFQKLQSLARAGEAGMPLDDAKRLDEYLHDPFQALATEAEGYPQLKVILDKLNEAISKSKLKLKSTRLRKAQEQINTILNKDALITLQQNCKQANAKKQQLLTSETAATLQNKLTQLQDRCKQLQKENEATALCIKTLQEEHRKLQERITSEKRDIEKVITELTGKTVQISLD
jgi:DNA repair exonuclease SbcCD ATPase subunit